MPYFDYNANWPITQDVIDSYCKGAHIGNVSSANKLAKYGKDTIDLLIKEVAAEHGDYDVVLTSGGSESNSCVINHWFRESVKERTRLHFVCSTAEHSSITEGMLSLEQDDLAEVSWVRPQPNGQVRVEELISAVLPETACVFLQSVNSETGYIQSIASLANQLRQTGVALHVDNVQGYKKIKYPANVGDTIAISFHKIGAPLGLGALLIKKQPTEAISLNQVGQLHTHAHLNPLIYGKQNSGLRGGTYNIGAIVATYARVRQISFACVSAYKTYFLGKLTKHFTVISYQAFDAILRTIQQTKGANQSSAKSQLANGSFAVLYSDAKCLPSTIFMSLVIRSTALCGDRVKQNLQNLGYTIGTGSACNSDSKSEIGSMLSSSINDALKKSFIRISYGCDVTESQLDGLANALGSQTD